MTASCIDDEVSMPSLGLTMTKENVSIIVVLFDLLISFYLWFALLFLRPLAKATEIDIVGDTLSADDFTVIVDQIPHKDKVEDLKAIYWAWAEQILERDEFSYKIPVEAEGREPLSEKSIVGNKTWSTLKEQGI